MNRSNLILNEEFIELRQLSSNDSQGKCPDNFYLL